jgi:outer membrane protein TolC
LSPQLQVLTADLNRLSAEQTVTNLKMRRRDLQFALIRALGGGFEARAAGIALPAAASQAGATVSSG